MAGSERISHPNMGGYDFRAQERSGEGPQQPPHPSHGFDGTWDQRPDRLQQVEEPIVRPIVAVIRQRRQHAAERHHHNRVEVDEVLHVKLK